MTLTWTKMFPAVLAALGGLALAYQPRSGAAYTLSPVEYGMQLKTPDGRVVLEYMTKKAANAGMTSPSAACFHPVNTPAGERISALAPDDHPHHRGIFFGWHDSEFREPANFANYGDKRPLRGLSIRRADFWGWGEYAPREGRVIETKDVKLVRADSTAAQLEIRSDWMVGSRKMLDEVNQVRVTERDAVYLLDFEYRLTPMVDYFLDRSAFGGFDVQFRKDGESYYTNSAGKVSYPDPHFSYPELNWPSAPWYGYVIKLAGGKSVGGAVIDHPQNPPTTWHNSSRLWMLNPAITGAGPMNLKGGQTLTLRYRLVVHDGETPTALIERLSAEYRKI